MKCSDSLLKRARLSKRRVLREDVVSSAEIWGLRPNGHQNGRHLKTLRPSLTVKPDPVVANANLGHPLGVSSRWQTAPLEFFLPLLEGRPACKACAFGT